MITRAGKEVVRGAVSESQRTTHKVTAIGPGDLALYALPVHQRKVRRALDVIQHAAEIGRIGICFSGGKDSTVLVDLVRRIVPDAVVGFFDTGCEYPWTYDLCERLGASVLHTEESMLDVIRRCGYWGYEKPTEPDAEVSFFDYFVLEPARRFVAEERIAVMAMGLRADESKGRWLSLHRRDRGTLYPVAYDGTWHLCPLAFWGVDDIWAYIAGRDLAYNRLYDLETALGVPRREQRVSCLLSAECIDRGRFARLRQTCPDLYARFVQEFPKIGGWT